MTPTPGDPISPNDDARDLVARASARIADDARQEREAMAAAARPRQRPWAVPLLALLVALNVVAWFVIAPAGPETAGPPPAVVERDLRAVMASIADEVTAWRAQHGSLPASLAAAGIERAEVSYTVSGEAFELRMRNGDAEVVYDSRTAAPGGGR